MLITRRIIKVSSLFVSFFFVLTQGNLLGIESKVAIKGRYDAQDRTFIGVVTHSLTCSPDETFKFHLPANRFSKGDWRTEFVIPGSDGTEKTFKRSDLGGLKSFHKQNLHTPKSIEILEVYLDGKPIPFNIVENSSLSPLNNINRALLFISHESLGTVCQDNELISIKFKTEFNKISKDWVDLLWDFAPRPVISIHGQVDFEDHWSKPSRYNYDIIATSSSQKKEEIHLKVSKVDIVPTLVVKGHNRIDEENVLTLDDYLKDDATFFIKRLQKVKKFLRTQHWVKDLEFNQHLALWDGPLTVTGSHILLPHGLFRYYSIYHKTFEIVILKAFIHSILIKRFYINSVQHPWIVPAITSEIVRDYFIKQYNGNTRLFPWGLWLNPDYYQQNSIKTWLTLPGEKEVIAAEENKDLNLLSNVYHPWYEKGFHLFRTITTRNEEIRSQIYPALKNVLQHEDKELPLLNKKNFAELFNLSDKQTVKLNRWLSLDGSVDYKIEKVDVIKKENRTETTVSVADLGTISPPFELYFMLDNGLQFKEEVYSGNRTYNYTFPSPPVEVQIDPDHKLLESNLLNNYWSTPYKVRPIWDFPSTDNWVVILSPVINGNTFDKNLFGLSFSVSYLNETEFYISGWRSEDDEQILWESSLVHYGFPWQGSEIYLESSELNASYSKILGYKQNFVDVHKDLWFSIDLMEETLDSLDEDVSSDNDCWQSIETTLSFPVYIGDFSDSAIQLFGGYGYNIEDTTNDFYRQGIESDSIWYLGNWKTHLELSANYSYGLVPTQKKYPIGGPEALPGFPREEELLYDQRIITGIGLTFPPYFSHTNLNALRLGWLDKVETGLFLHWAEAESAGMEQADQFRDVELRFTFTVSWLNMYEGDGVLSIAQPIDHEKYKDYRIILFSNWVF